MIEQQHDNLIGLAEVRTYLGKELGKSDWHTITQEQINKFAEATLDFQWIHTDEQRSKAESPYKTTIAHGFLTLSLAPYLINQIFRIKDRNVGINYGLNNVKFTSVVPVNSRIRLVCSLLEFNDRTNITTMVLGLLFELEGSSKSVCQAEYKVLIKK